MSLPVALLAAAAWQVTPLVVVEDIYPVLCGYVYRHESGIDLRVEKGIRGTLVFTAVDVVGTSPVRLTTRSFDSERDLNRVESTVPGRVRLEGDLQTSDAGGLLFAELGVSGGQLEIGVTPGSRAPGPATAGSVGPVQPEALDQAHSSPPPQDQMSGASASDRLLLELPAPLPRGVTAMYLNCAGDLIRPD